MSKYIELQEKMKKNHKKFKDYENECRQFIQSFRSALIEYLGCPENRVKWIAFSPDEPEESLEAKGVIDLSIDRRMALYEDAFYGFIFQILFFDPNSGLAGGYYLKPPMKVKKDGSKFTVEFGGESKQVNQGNTNDLENLVKDLVTMLEDYLDTEYEHFLQGQQRYQMGFPVIGGGRPGK